MPYGCCTGRTAALGVSEIRRPSLTLSDGRFVIVGSRTPISTVY